jgi:hypothetical protein
MLDGWVSGHHSMVSVVHPRVADEGTALSKTGNMLNKQP